MALVVSLNLEKDYIVSVFNDLLHSLNDEYSSSDSELNADTFNEENNLIFRDIVLKTKYFTHDLKLYLWPVQDEYSLKTSVELVSRIMDELEAVIIIASEKYLHTYDKLLIALDDFLDTNPCFQEFPIKILAIPKLNCHNIYEFHQSTPFLKILSWCSSKNYELLSPFNNLSKSLNPSLLANRTSLAENSLGRLKEALLSHYWKSSHLSEKVQNFSMNDSVCTSVSDKFDAYKKQKEKLNDLVLKVAELSSILRNENGNLNQV